MSLCLLLSMLKGIFWYGSLFEMHCYVESGDAVLMYYSAAFQFHQAMNMPVLYCSIFNYLSISSGYEFEKGGI